MKSKKHYPWFVGSAVLTALALTTWSQVEISNPVSDEEADAAALELANSLDFGFADDSPPPSETTIDTPPEPKPKPEPEVASEMAAQEPTPRPVLTLLPGMPQPITEDDFQALRSSSPFTRSLNLSDSLILTGIAKIGDETIATILDKNSKESYVVGAAANAQGWRMVEVDGDRNDLEKVTARISVAGGEVVSIRFDENRLKPGEGKPAAGSGGGKGGGDGKGDGERRRGPPSDMREKMSKLSEEQRGKLFEKMRQIREKNPDMTREQMGEKFRAMADQLIEKNDKN
ncbi:MAG: hypothetical protein AAGH89_00620 [Verrucomicrobiota bacterium]